MFDCHIHSSFSFDSDMDALQACETATERGLSGIAFVDHLDYDFPDYEYDLTIDFKSYLQLVESLNQDYYPHLKVLRGIEVGIQPHVINKSELIIKQYDFDYVLASVHILDGEDPYKGFYYQGKSKIEAYNGYLEHVLYMVSNFCDFDMCGHIDYIIRCACYDDRTLRYSEHSDILDSIFKVLIEKGKGFELNTGSYRTIKNGIPFPEFDISILKRYRELGGEIICMGSDSHSLEHIGCNFEFFKELLMKTGFKYTTHFEKRKPVFAPV